jgi:hypothetical protein
VFHRFTISTPFWYKDTFIPDALESRREYKILSKSKYLYYLYFYRYINNIPGVYKGTYYICNTCARQDIIGVIQLRFRNNKSCYLKKRGFSKKYQTWNDIVVFPNLLLATIGNQAFAILPNSLQVCLNLLQ